ncbi:MAG: hypothetical protein JXQ71_01710 [Verrucomicrobia bacterium]|nr:hypothetical protein [Verrucomicrobiota bacterium]
MIHSFDLVAPVPPPPRGTPRANRRAPALRAFVMLATLLALTGRAEMAVRLFDTGTRATAPLTAEALARQEAWTPVPEDQTRHAFRGDAVAVNGRIALVLRQAGRGAELHALTPAGAVRRAELLAVADAPAASLASLAILENSPGGVAVDATFHTTAGATLTLAYALNPGQVFVRTEPRSGARALRVVAPCRFAVLPDFFADDMVLDAASVGAAQAELPGENFLLHLLGRGEAIAMVVWHPAREDIRLRLDGPDHARTIASSDIAYAPRGAAWVALLDAPGIWHHRDVAETDADKILRLDWRAPFAAHWRVDWRRADQLTDSWEMITQRPDGMYVKHGWYGQAEAFGNTDWQHEGRTRWTTVLGRFQYPCWIDREGAGHLQPLKKGVRFAGPALLYPITRLDTTPLDAFTVVDVMRATLGIGPCEYVLDVEGQKKTSAGRPTCASRTILDGIYAKRQQKEKRAVVLQTLDEVIAFVRHIRTRIEDYLAFGRALAADLERQKTAQPELAGWIRDMQDVLGLMDGYVAKRRDAIKTPEYATRLVEEFRTRLVDDESEDSTARCKRITAALVDIGGNQDELVGECRMVVKILRQRAGLAMAANPKTAPIARELRRRTQQMLRNPTSYEAPRH